MKSLVTVSRVRRMAGAAMLDLAIGLPVFLMCVFGMLWIAARHNSDLSLTTAVGVGLKLAITRPYIWNTDMTGVGVFADDIGEFKRPGGTATPRLQTELLAHGVEWNVANIRYDRWLARSFAGGQHLQTLPEPYLYALVYIGQALRQSEGSTVRYPCNPDEPSDPQHGAGCLECRFLSPGTGQSNECAEPPTDACVLPSQLRFGVECRYRPAFFFLDTVSAMLRVLGLSALVPPPVRQRGMIDIPKQYFNVEGT